MRTEYVGAMFEIWLLNGFAGCCAVGEKVEGKEEKCRLSCAVRVDRVLVRCGWGWDWDTSVLYAKDDGLYRPMVIASRVLVREVDNTAERSCDVKLDSDAD